MTDESNTWGVDAVFRQSEDPIIDGEIFSVTRDPDTGDVLVMPGGQIRACDMVIDVDDSGSTFNDGDYLSEAIRFQYPSDFTLVAP